MKRIVILFLLFFCSTSGISYAQQASKPVSAKKIDQWIAQRDWAGGIILSPHLSVNKAAFYEAYHTNKKLWDAAFAFMKTHDLVTIASGKYPILGDTVFASVTEDPSKKMEDAKWESHKKYNDLQYIIKGKEIIGVADASKATVTKPYTPDAMNYIADGTYYTTDPGTFFLFFPNDAHRPTIKADGYDVVKKIVIKIQVAKAE
jgi:YhcH/YjgK/YiaL family protein